MAERRVARTQDRSFESRFPQVRLPARLTPLHFYAIAALGLLWAFRAVVNPCCGAGAPWIAILILVLFAYVVRSVNINLTKDANSLMGHDVRQKRRR